MDSYYHPNIQGDQIQLGPEESMHCVKVMRRKPGDRVNVVDGKGGFYQTKIAETDRSACLLTIEDVEQEYKKLGYDLHIGIAPTKNMDRFEWFLEKTTEIGIGSITPLLCEHSERKHLRYDRLEKIMISAMKQSDKAFLPNLNELTPYHDWLSGLNAEMKLIAHCEEEGHRLNIWRAGKSSSIAIAIGPEGDFSPGEIQAAREAGFTPISLGDHRLRTETAGVVACSAVYFNMQG